MPFYLYRKPTAETAFLEQLHTVSLAGYNAIYKGWKKHGRPIDQGWHIDQGELIRLAGGDPDKHIIVIDLKPSSEDTLDLYELLDIHAFTDSDPDTQEVKWSPVMLRLHELWCEPRQKMTKNERDALIARFLSPPRYTGNIFEFLYLQGEKRGWNWGRNGQVNAVLLYENARKYFFSQVAHYDDPDS